MWYIWKTIWSCNGICCALRTQSCRLGTDGVAFGRVRSLFSLQSWGRMKNQGRRWLPLGKPPPEQAPFGATALTLGHEGESGNLSRRLLSFNGAVRVSQMPHKHPDPRKAPTPEGNEEGRGSLLPPIRAPAEIDLGSPQARLSLALPGSPSIRLYCRFQPRVTPPRRPPLTT